MRVGIVGAGLAGLAAAARLREAGLEPVVFEKSRGIGGRLATRRATLEDGRRLAVDHGAPAVAPGPEGFAAFLRDAIGDGDAAEVGGGFVGVPGMSALPRRLAADLEIRFQTRVATVTPEAGVWRVGLGEGGSDLFDRVVITAPAPQAVALLESAPNLAAEAGEAAMSPIWTIIAAWDAAMTAREIFAPEAPLATLAVATGRPGRPATPFALAAHAGEAWSAEHLDIEREAAVERLLPALGGTLGLEPEAAVYAKAHRWRFARTSRPVGRPFLGEAGLFVAGDWLLGAEAGDAWASGRAAAEALLATG